MKRLLVLLLSVGIISGILVNSSTSNLSSEQEMAEKNREKLVSLESKNVTEIQDSIDKYKEELEAKNNPSKNTNSAMNFKNIFKDDVFLGDSQSEGLNLYGFLNDSSVVAKKGKTLNQALNDVNTIKNLSPKRIFVLFGLNDLINYKNLSDLQRAYGVLIDSLKENVPNAKIYVNSMLPARSDAISKQPLVSLDRNSEGNQLIRELCKEKEVEYVDITYILNENKNLYESDGMHCKPDFYKIWLTKLSSLK
ncbi:MAG: hypothetical protein GX275_09925 [Clostridiales bacterium]|nr:hypothetical protein [Clostridiales bacterium]